MVVIRIHLCPWELEGMIFVKCSLHKAGEAAEGAPWVNRVRRFQGALASRTLGADREGHESRPLLEVYRGCGWKRQRNRQDEETKVTRAGAEAAPEREWTVP